MLNNIPMIRLLLHYGADESSKGMSIDDDD